MAQNSKIEWTHHTVNLWWGCSKVHAGCDNCYAEYLSDTRYKNGLWGNNAPRKQIKKAFSDLDKFQKLAAEANENHRVFVGSMMDIFEKPMPLVDSKGNAINAATVNAVDHTIVKKWIGTDFLRHRLFTQINAGFYPNLVFLFLTKRPSNINKYIPESWIQNPPSNVWFGVSVSDQQTANTLIPQLANVNGKRFLSLEPQLGPVNLFESVNGETLISSLNWVIQGGESGHNKRPFNLDWAYSMKMQCKYTVDYFFKQIDKIQPIPEDLLIRELSIF